MNFHFRFYKKIVYINNLYKVNVNDIKKVDGKQRIEIFNCMMNKKSKLEYKNRFDLI